MAKSHPKPQPKTDQATIDAVERAANRARRASRLYHETHLLALKIAEDDSSIPADFLMFDLLVEMVRDEAKIANCRCEIMSIISDVLDDVFREENHGIEQSKPNDDDFDDNDTPEMAMLRASTTKTDKPN